MLVHSHQRYFDSRQQQVFTLRCTGTLCHEAPSLPEEVLSSRLVMAHLYILQVLDSMQRYRQLYPPWAIFTPSLVSLHLARQSQWCGRVQGIWWDDVPMMMLPHMTEDAAEALMQQGLRSLHQLRQAALGQPAAMKTRLASLLGGSKQAAECLQVRPFLCLPLHFESWRNYKSTSKRYAKVSTESLFLVPESSHVSAHH